MHKIKFGIDDILKHVKDVYSYHQLLVKLNVASCGGNYVRLQTIIKNNNVDITHFTGQAWRKHNSFPFERVKLENILVKNSVYSSGVPIHSGRIKEWLFAANLKEKCCEKCKLYIWLSKPIPLELHHIDGDKKNNELVNLQILCPNCHSLTDNYRGKKLKKKKPRNINHKALKKDELERLGYIIENCGIDFNKYGWVAKLAPLIGRKEQKVNYIIKKYFNEFYEKQCFKRKIKKMEAPN